MILLILFGYIILLMMMILLMMVVKEVAVKEVEETMILMNQLFIGLSRKIKKEEPTVLLVVKYQLLRILMQE